MNNIKKIWVQKRDDGSLAIESSAIYQHCILNDIKSETFSGEDVLNGRFQLEQGEMIVGSVQAVTHGLGSLGINAPEPDYYPEALSSYLYRDVELTWADDVIAMIDSGKSVFAKSLEWKLFTGHVVDHDDTDGLMSLEGTPMWISEPVKWLTEYRVYVVDNQIVSIAGYDGDEDIMIDREVVEIALLDLIESGYDKDTFAFDWGVLSTGETALVEMNDAWAIGLYHGISGKDYSNMLIRRWQQIVASKERT